MPFDPFRYRNTLLSPLLRHRVSSTPVGSAIHAPIGKGSNRRGRLPVPPAPLTPGANRPPRRLVAGPAILMPRSVTYIVLITKHPRGFVANCLALSDCVVLGKSRAGAYKAIKDLIRRRLTRLIEDHHTLPSDPVVSVKHLRINLFDIHKEVNLQ